MTNPRLSLAVQSGLVSLPDDGTIVVFGARADSDLSALPKTQTHIVQGLKPDHDALDSAGWTVSPDAPATAALAIVFLPRAKAQARDMLAHAAEITTGTLVVDGAKTDGIDSIFKEMRKRGDASAALSKAHGKLFTVPANTDLSDWRATLQTVDGGYQTAPGVFSADGVDPASELLGAALPAKLGARIADLGAGWGYLSMQILANAKVQTVDLVEADHTALACARQNVTDPRARFHWADATTWVGDAKYDAVVMNPPFHTTRSAEPDLGRAFIASAARLLSPSGSLWMVANRHLAYEATLGDLFAQVTEIGGDNRFKIIHAARPSRQRR